MAITFYLLRVIRNGYQCWNRLVETKILIYNTPRDDAGAGRKVAGKWLK